ncbi:MAG: CBS domain-containing protein, partial [Candidatus Nanohaloarchaea archaeon]
RHLMLDNNISRVPVLDEEGDVTGLIDSTDILGMMIKRERQPAGGTSTGGGGEDFKGDKTYVAGGNERDKMSEISADQLMHENYSRASDHMSGTEAVDQMLDEKKDDILFVDDGYPEAILTLKDLIDHVADYAQQQTILVQLTGVDVPEEKAVIQDKLKKQVQGSLGRKLEKPQDLSLRIKKAEKDGKKHRWELDLKLVSEYGVTTVNEEGWELMDALDEALDELNRIIRDKHGKETEHR